MANFDINVYIIAREEFSSVQNRPGTVRCPADLLHRPMLSYTDVSRRPYDM